MDDLLAGLSKQQAMLLLTAVAFGGQESMRALEHVPEDQEQPLRDRARRILQIPRERRVPYLVQEIKRLVASKRTDGLGGASAAHVAAALQGERPSVVEALLRALPSELAKDARLALRHPGIKLSRELRPALLAALRWRFEEKLARTPPPPKFTMDDLPRLSTADVSALCDALGARFLAHGLAAAGGSDRAKRLAQLSPEQRVAAERPGAGNPRMDREVARRWVDGIFSAPDPQGAVRDLGLRRLARACNAASASLAREVAEAHPGDIGGALIRLAEEERAQPQAGADACRREVLSELQVLAARGAGVSDRPEACAPAAQRTRFPAGPRRPKP